MRMLLLFLITVAGVALQPLQAAAADLLTIGVAPHTSARIILEMYQPLRLHLEKAIGMPADIVTAPDFTTFAQRGLKQD